MYKPEFNREKFRELVLYIAHKSRDDPWFGAVKLNKILYYCDFGAYARLYRSITGATYIHLTEGPAPVEMLEERRVMIDTGQATLELQRVFRYVQHRIYPTADNVVLSELFDSKEIEIIDETISTLRPLTGKEVSDLSHRELGWKLTVNRELIPYETAWMVPDDDIDVAMMVENAKYHEVTPA